MPVDKALLSQKLKQLEVYIKGVRDLKGRDKKLFVAGSETEDAAERRLERAVQCAIDIAAHIVTQEALGNPNKYKDLFFFLGRVGILSPDLTERLEKMAGFRNLLIHEYAVIDEAKVYEVVNSDIDDLVVFARLIAEKYLASVSA